MKLLETFLKINSVEIIFATGPEGTKYGLTNVENCQEHVPVRLRISTKKTVFGYLAIQDGFKIDKVWESYSTNTKAKVGANNGEKFSLGQKIYIKKNNKNTTHNNKHNLCNTKTPDACNDSPGPFFYPGE